MKKLASLIDGHAFDRSEARAFIHAIADDQVSAPMIAAVLVAIEVQGVTLDALDGFREGLLERCVSPNIDASEAIDLCGTGGDGKNTFNISTTTALVLAAMGRRVIKHGNYGVSSLCGSSNVLEALGFTFAQDATSLQRQLDTLNICFLHAPLFHPTLHKVADVRKSLGVRTLFNCLGPLVNPVQPAFQLTGTFSLELAHLYRHLLNDHRKGYAVVHGMKGYDELTLSDSTRVLGKNSDYTLNASNFSRPYINPQDIVGGATIQASAGIVKRILRGEASDAQTDIIAANVALAESLFEPNIPIEEHYSKAQSFIRKGTAAHHFNSIL